MEMECKFYLEKFHSEFGTTQRVILSEERQLNFFSLMELRSQKSSMSVNSNTQERREEQETGLNGGNSSGRACPKTGLLGEQAGRVEIELNIQLQFV